MRCRKIKLVLINLRYLKAYEACAKDNFEFLFILYYYNCNGLLYVNK